MLATRYLTPRNTHETQDVEEEVDEVEVEGERATVMSVIA